MTSISRTIETMQANIRSARQDKSFKGVSYTLDSTAITAGGTAKNLTISGGAVGTTPVNVSLNTAATAASLTGVGSFTNAGGGGAAGDVGRAGSLSPSKPPISTAELP
jgi:flagellin